jgi:type I restriction enzyme R subunit
MLIEGITVEQRRKDRSIAGVQAGLVDFDNPENNDWLAVNQFAIQEGQNNRRPDIVLFVNGLPLAVIELKNAVDENPTIWSAFNRLQNLQDRNSLALLVQRGARRVRRARSPDRVADRG